MSIIKYNGTANILVVDDEVDNLLIISEYLRDAGYQGITTVSDPFKALTLFAEGAFDLVLLDIIMPGLDGFAVMEKIRLLGTEKSCPISAAPV